jgi:hypothetical protein
MMGASQLRPHPDPGPSNSTRPCNTDDQRLCWLGLVWWAWEDLNLRPHPYQGSAPGSVSPGSRLPPARTTYRWRPLETVANRSAPLACGPNVDQPRRERGQRRSASRTLPRQGRPPPAAPDKRAPPATALVGGALAGSGPGTSPCIDGLSLVTGMVVPQRPSSSNQPLALAS